MLTAQGPISSVKATLGEIGWGAPGLVSDDTQISCSVTGLEISFEIEVSIELKAGSEKGGFTLPLPFPKHRGVISGWFNEAYRTHFARFHEFGED